MNETEIKKIFEKLRKEVELVLSCHFHIKCNIDYEGKYPKKRDYAMTSGEEVFLSPKILKADVNRVQGLLRHELGHAVLMQAGLYEHSERQVDKLAEVLFGDVIYYDQDDIQTINSKNGVSPRPSYLPN
jgi:predicted metal-dependent peptidase